jgi:hypothetical protein
MKSVTVSLRISKKDLAFSSFGFSKCSVVTDSVPGLYSTNSIFDRSPPEFLKTEAAN